MTIRCSICDITSDPELNENHLENHIPRTWLKIDGEVICNHCQNIIMDSQWSEEEDEYLILDEDFDEDD